MKTNLISDLNLVTKNRKNCIKCKSILCSTQNENGKEVTRCYSCQKPLKLAVKKS